jgi:phospholipase/carboxylesterase
VIQRRHFIVLAGGAFTSLAGGACRRGIARLKANGGRIQARPRGNVATSASGMGPLGLDRERDAILKIPAKTGAAPLPLLVMLHGAGQSADWMLERIDTDADDAGVAVLAPNSRESTWDALHDGFGPDVAFVNRALERVFDTVDIDPTRITVGGFSDGATYAISLGLINGDLFSRVLAFSPGFVIDGTAQGTPQFFISHGTADRILPIDRCSRRIVRDLRERRYDVTFKEFDGGHQIPADIAREGLRWAAHAA